MGELVQKEYQMLVNQITPEVYKLRLLSIESPGESIVFETLATTIPLTRDLIQRYKSKRLFSGFSIPSD